MEVRSELRNSIPSLIHLNVTGKLPCRNEQVTDATGSPISMSGAHGLALIPGASEQEKEGIRTKKRKINYFTIIHFYT